LSATVTKLAISQLLSQQLYYKCALRRSRSARDGHVYHGEKQVWVQKF